MPIYWFECKECKKVYEKVYKVKECPEAIHCDPCGLLAFKIIAPIQNVKPTWDPYYDEHLGEMITCRGQRKRLMKEQGLEERPLDKTTMRLRLEERRHIKREEAKNARG